MKQNKRKITIAGCVICLLAVVSLSKPGRIALGEFLTLIRSKASTVFTGAGMQTGNPDKEQRARGQHGWGPNVNNSIVRGTIAFFDDGVLTHQARVTIYRKYPNRVRVEVEEDGIVDAWGFDHNEAWKLRSANLTEEKARDIRAWVRLSPERLFLMRGANNRYREAGRHLEDARPTVSGSGPLDMTGTGDVEEIEMEDIILPPATRNPHRAGDRRLVYYQVDKDNNVIHSARWLEPDDPQADIDDPATPKMDVRVDFGNWRRVEGILWPMEITHRLGGKVDFRIFVSDVLVNQQMPDTVFQNPNR